MSPVENYYTTRKLIGKLKDGRYDYIEFSNEIEDEYVYEELLPILEDAILWKLEKL